MADTLASASGPAITSDDVDHAADRYADAYIRDILRDTRVIAMVGASTNWNRPSYFAMKYLQQKGYRVIPVNPRAAGETLLGETVVGDLAGLEDPVDMVDIFRNSEAAGGIVDQALALDPRPKVIWMQLGVVNHEAAARAEAAGVRVVMNRCPKIEYARLSGELGWNGINSRVITAKKRAI
ncbi:CoA-binding protein [Marivibrio halodurans]|uniref:CoA-binding protein n=1 Tax=Marivibrio halodurans TaxID=2039722 RepID=A0A8J7RXX6_9PROT|nr:CoA-binding protein [Marivibrio halodurans]MBP5856787.1 CoA-binding protein [Marivibrio halodurans]